MAAYLKQHLGLESELIMGSKGIFRVEADGKQIFDKYEEGSFPESEEVAERLCELLASRSSSPGASGQEPPE